MRIQHNIPAMSSYRNYSHNVSSVAKNLEKLSSGYRINRAGDDAAGLAVSEKMRLQISGLAQAQKNAKSAISYVQTAEGALTEVHDMLNRMYTIAEQSANGTYDKDTDRVQLEKELKQLRTEINRIGKTANFNGIGIFTDYKPADAVSDTAGAAAGGDADTPAGTADTPVGLADGSYTAGTPSDKTGSATLSSFTTAPTDWSDTTAANLVINDLKNGTVSVTVATKSYTVKLVADADKTAADVTAGKEVVLTADGTDSTKVADSASDLLGKIQDALTTQINAANTTNEAKNQTYIKVTDLALTPNGTDKDKIDIAYKETTQTYNAGGATPPDGGGDDDGDGGDGGDGGVWFAIGAESGEANKLTLNAMTLNTGKMTIAGTSVTAGNIDDISIATQNGAWGALESIKQATNAVSDMRGTLGAMQNRLDHTINNLGVMQENMQDAESVIRDVDVAEEMMAYTKNSILVQSAQAMLAQANQLPQGVLQLLG